MLGPVGSATTVICAEQSNSLQLYYKLHSTFNFLNYRDEEEQKLLNTISEIGIIFTLVLYFIVLMG